jgi:hypothetical protein
MQNYDSLVYNEKRNAFLFFDEETLYGFLASRSL